jgi:hypothetical protein
MATYICASVDIRQNHRRAQSAIGKMAKPFWLRGYSGRPGLSFKHSISTHEGAATVATLATVERARSLIGSRISKGSKGKVVEEAREVGRRHHVVVNPELLASRD